MSRPPEVAPGKPQQPPEYIAGHIRQAFAGDSRVGDPTINVEIEGKKIYLRGYVNSDERKEALTEVAAENAPGYDIHNDVQVASPNDPGEMEKLQ